MKVTTDACLFGAWCAHEIEMESSLQQEQNICALEIGTGTGLLSLMIAQKASLTIDAVEIDADAAKQAMKNCASSPFAARIHIYQSDILQFGNQQYNYIISNPPFYENEVKSQQITKNIAHHSYQLRLEEVFAIVENNLLPDGTFFLLLPFKRKKELEFLLKQQNLFATKIIFLRPSVLHPPFRIMLKGCKINVEMPFITEIPITNKQKQYTYEFKELLKDYYLKL
ncbi:MAG: tRNA1(Val) (adenine(37)-N6)-methyltransferase [Chitinophagaceae bacterium]